jgi:hypothetical protein
MTGTLEKALIKYFSMSLNSVEIETILLKMICFSLYGLNLKVEKSYI